MKKALLSAKAPKPLGPYSQAVISGNLVFVSGQLPIDAGTGKMSTENIEKQTRLVFGNIDNILSECGSGLRDILKVDVYLENLDDFLKMNAEYERIFNGSVMPARCVVEASRLPGGAGVIISCIAALPGAGGKTEK